MTPSRRRIEPTIAVVTAIVSALLMAAPSSSRAAAPGAWEETGSLTTARQAGHKATLLDPPLCRVPNPPASYPCGTVLVTGGTLAEDAPFVTTYSDGAELYDPLADDPATGRPGSWKSCPRTETPSSRCPAPMIARRAGHSAVLLNDGNVLVVGGECVRAVSGGCSPRLSAELYDPETGTWSVTGTPKSEGSEVRTGGFQATTALLDGAACRDASTPAWCGKVLAVFERLTTEIYDPGIVENGIKGAWRNTLDSLDLVHKGLTATALLDGRVLVVGDSGTGGQVAELFEPGTEQWTPAASPPAPRSDHTATLLDGIGCGTSTPKLWCGKVLLAGGQRATEAPQLFDPATNGFIDVAGFVLPGFAQGAALPNGRVLMVGGRETVDGSFVPSGLSVIYDADTNSWTATGSLVTPRSGHEVTKLGDDKKIMVIGGSGSAGTLASSEVYEAPAAVTDAIPLVSGLDPNRSPTQGGVRVTITGENLGGAVKADFGGNEATDIRVVDDQHIVVTAPQHAEGDVPVSVTVASGYSTSPVSFSYFMLGAWSPTGFWGVSAEMPTATVLADGRILAAGGSAISREAPRTLYSSRTTTIFNPALADAATGLQGSWEPTGSLALGRFDHTATLLNDGTVMAAGGLNRATNGLEPGTPLAEVEIFDPAATDPVTGAKGRWLPTSPMAVPRIGHTATPLADGTVLVAGGDAAGTAEVYDPRSRTWAPVGGLSASRYRPTATLLGGPACAGSSPAEWCNSVLIAGGQAYPVGEVRANAELYDPKSRSWSTAGSLATARVGHTSTRLGDGNVLVAGGFGGGSNYLASAEIFDPAAIKAPGGPWRSTGPLVEPRDSHTATLLPNGTVLIAGGPDTSATGIRSADIYVGAQDEGRGGFVPAAPMIAPRRYHAAALIPSGPVASCGSNCGRVLLFGGRGAAALLNSAELFTPAPVVTEVSPSLGPQRGGTRVTITGTGLAAARVVRFGDIAVEATPDPLSPDTTLTAVVPAGRSPGEVAVEVVTRPDPDTLLRSLPSEAGRFTYVPAVPGAILDLAAVPTSEEGIDLSFSAPRAPGSSDTDPPPATEYVVKQSETPIIDPAGFDAAFSLCGSVCRFEPPPKLEGDAVALAVGGLSPGRTYHFAVRALGPNGEQGPLSNPASATTLGEDVVVPAGCPPLSRVEKGQVRFPQGYSLVGVPGGTNVRPGGDLFGWLNQGAAGQYERLSATEGVSSGRGYWAWFACPRVVGLGATGAVSVTLPLDAYRASMVGNPSAISRATVDGFDFAASWDRSLNDGVGGYRLSGYREAQSLPVGRGLWVFSYVATKIHIEGSG